MNNVEIRGHITSWEAAKYIIKFSIIILRNFIKSTNRFVHCFPWVCIILTIAISAIVSFIQISKARAERDSYNKTLVQTQMKLDSYQSAFGNDYKK